MKVVRNNIVKKKIGNRTTVKLYNSIYIRGLIYILFNTKSLLPTFLCYDVLKILFSYRKNILCSCDGG